MWTRLAPRPGEVGELVAAQPEPAQRGAGGAGLGQRLLVAGEGEPAGAGGAGQRHLLGHHLGVEGERVGRDVDGAAGHGAGGVGGGDGHRGAAGRLDEVDADVGDDGGRGGDGAGRRLAVVAAAELRQHARVEGLHADGDPVDAGLAPGQQPLPVAGLRVGLDGHLGAGAAAPQRAPHPGHHLGHLLGRPARRGAAAEVEADAASSAVERRGPQRQLGQHRRGRSGRRPAPAAVVTAKSQYGQRWAQ